MYYTNAKMNISRTWVVLESLKSELQLHFIHQVVLVRRQGRDLLIFESSSHPSTTHGGGFTVFLISERQAEKLCDEFLFSLVRPDRESNPSLPF